MARGVSAEERVSATLIPAGAEIPLDDVDDAFDQWRDATAQAQIPGKITVWQIPMDDHGVPQPSAKNQVRLGAWPVDAYDFDGLCSLLIREFMPPEKILCVRMLGTKIGTAGLQFNRVLTLRAPNVTDKPSNGAAPAESTAGLMKVIQENNERMLSQFRSMLPQTPQRDVADEIQRMLAFSQTMNAPMMQMLGQLLPALVGRPAPAGAENPFGMVTGLIGAFKQLNELRGDGGGGGDDAGDPDSFGGILKSLVPVMKPALEAIPAILASRGPAAVAPRALPNPAARPAVPPPGSVPTQPQPQPATNLNDMSTGDQQMFAQLKPQIDALVAMAEQGSAADGAADILFEQVILELPDEYYGKLAELIGGPNFVTQAAVFNPKVNNHVEWFKTFQARIVTRYDAEDEAANSTVTPTPPPA